MVVVGSLCAGAGGGESLGETELAGKVFAVGERGAEGGDGFRGMALLEVELSARCPTLAQVFTMGFEGLEEEPGD